MEWKVTDDYPDVKIEDNIISGLKDWLQTSGVHCKVSLELCDPFFWLTEEQRKAMQGPIGTKGDIGPRGPIGLAGPRGPIGNYGPSMPDVQKKVADPNRVLVKIEFRLSNEQAEQLKTHQLSLTKNQVGETLPTWELHKMQQELPYACGVYKKPGFNTAFGAMKAMKASLTEEEFARNVMPWNPQSDTWDKDLVNLELFHGWVDCIKVFKGWTAVYTGDTVVRMCLLAPDVNANFEYITGLLSVYVPQCTPV